MKKKTISSLFLGAFLSFGCSHLMATAPEVHIPEATVIEIQNKTETPIVLDLNTVTAEELQQHLNGVGQNKAQNIIEYREKYGPFISVNQLLEVQGIGASLLERNRDKLKIWVCRYFVFEFFVITANKKKPTFLSWLCFCFYF